MRESKWLRLVAGLLALSLFAASCGGSSDDSGSDSEEGSATSSEGADAGSDAGSDEGSSETVDLSQSGGLLATVRDRGKVVCGITDALPGFGLVGSDGSYSGFDVDYCRVIAAGILGDADAVEFKPLTAEVRFTALQAGEIDVLVRNTTWTATRDGGEGANFLFTTFYDGQGMMVPASSGFTTLEELDGANICVQSGTTTELNLASVFGARGIDFTPVVFEKNDQLRPAYEEGQCEAWTSDASQLAAFKFSIEDGGGDEQFIMSEIISKEPLGPVVADGDTEWAQAVNWSVMATVQAWEFGLDSGNVGSYSGDDPSIKKFLGEAEVNLGLDADFAVNVISQVGNYEEIYNANIVPIGLVLAGSPNDLWTNGGLMYVPPYR